MCVLNNICMLLEVFKEHIPALAVLWLRHMGCGIHNPVDPSHNSIVSCTDRLLELPPFFIYACPV